MPRWFSANGYEDLGDPLTPPDEGDPIDGSPSSTAVPASRVPPEWWAEAGGRTAAASTTQGIFSAFSSVLAGILPAAKIVGASRTSFDLAEPDRAYHATGLYEEGPVYAAVGASGWVEIQRSGIGEMLEGLAPRVSRDGEEALIGGVGTIESASSAVGGWMGFSSDAVWDPTSLGFYRHPSTGAWVPLHPGDVRNDGLVPLAYSGSGLLRSSHRAAVDNLASFLVRCGAVETLASRTNLWTVLDDKAMWFFLDRLDGESLPDFSDRVLGTSWFGVDQTRQSVRDAVAASLGLGVVTYASRTASGIWPEAGYRAVSIRNIARTQLVEERLQYRSGQYWTRTSEPTRGTVFSGGYAYEVASVSGAVSAPGLLATESRAATARWVVDLWSESGSGVVFTKNMPKEGPDFVVLNVRGVDVLDPGEDVKARSFDRTWPGTRWGAALEFPVDSGLAKFDFVGNALLAETSDWYARVLANGGTVSNRTLLAVDAFVDGCKSDRVWDKLTRVNLFCGNQLAACLVPLKVGPGFATEASSGVVAANYTEATGILGNGIRYLDTGMLDSQTTLGDRHAGVYARTTGTTVRYCIGVATTAFTIRIDIGTGALAYRSGGTTSTSVLTSFSGHIVGVDEASGAALYKNGSGTAVTRGSTAPAGVSMHVLGGNGSTARTDARIAGYHFGTRLTSSEMAALYARMQAFQTALGRQV